MGHLALLILGTVAFGLWQQQTEQMEQSAATQGIRDLITRIARAQGVPVDVALAFAWLESRFDPRREGDRQWAFKRASKYRELVLDAPKFAANPWRTDAGRWHSYGLYQLLAPYHTLADEDPRKLLDPQINAERGIAEIRRLYQRYHDANAVRLAYVGCGPDGRGCPSDKVADVLGKLQRARALFQGVA